MKNFFLSSYTSTCSRSARSRLSQPARRPCYAQAAIRKRAPDLAKQYIGLSSQAETVASAVSQSDPLDRSVLLSELAILCQSYINCIFDGT